MDKFEIQKLRDLPIEGVAERLGMRVVRHKALCPFHDDHHPSMSFSTRRNMFRCFACDAHGGTIDLAMRYLDKGFREACEWLGGNNVEIPLSRYNVITTTTPHDFNASRYARYFERPWLSPDACKFLYEQRRLNPAVVKYCRLNSFRDWLQIPYFNQQGELVGIQQRYMGHDSSQPRFRFPQGSECGIYNLPVLNMLRPGDELWITEGCSDCWAMLSAGHKAIAIPSATLLTRKDKELLKSLDSLSPDPSRPLPKPLPRREGLNHKNNTDSQASPTGGGLVGASASPRGGLEGVSSRGGLEGVASRGGVVGAFSFHMYPDRDAPGERLFMQLQQVLPSLVHHQLPEGFKDFGEWYGSNA